MVKHRRQSQMRLRGRIWIEVGGAAAMTEAGADLLEQIHACGSLSEAARRLGFSYRRAWMLVDAMNRRWPRKLVTKAAGGMRGGGSAITELGQAALETYRSFQIEVESLLDRQERGFDAMIRPSLH